MSGRLSPRVLAVAAGTVVAAGLLAGFILAGDNSDRDEASRAGDRLLGSNASSGGVVLDGTAVSDAEFERLVAEHERAANPPESPAERAARSTAQGLYELLAEDGAGQGATEIDSQAFCELMSERARLQTVRYVQRSSGSAREWDCPSAVSHLVVRSKRTGGFKHAQGAEVVGVNTEGNRATASIRFEKVINSISLIREDGEWRAASNSTK